MCGYYRVTGSGGGFYGVAAHAGRAEFHTAHGRRRRSPGIDGRDGRSPGMTAQRTTCPRCAAPAGETNRFCGSCGAIVADVRQVAIPRTHQTPHGPCAHCKNETDADGYCLTCGNRRAEPDRDEARLGRVALITDRGLEHARNEDSAAAGMVGSIIAVAVCDGVSSSADAHRAAAAASTAGVDAMLVALAGSRTVRAAVFTGLARAAQAAAESGMRKRTATDPEIAPSCTYTAAAVVPTRDGRVQITVGNVGDSRVYWLPAPPGRPQQLTVDDSVAQELITAGFSAGSDAVQRGAHTLTRWLGADNDETPWSESSVQTITAVGPGALVLCSDGLWNYLPEAADIARVVIGADATVAARALTEHALAAGGEDNITVVVIPIEGFDE